MGHRHPRDGAFTRIELLVVALILVLLVGVFVLGIIHSERSTHTHVPQCVANLKQVILVELLWMNDNEKPGFSSELSTNKGGTLEYVREGKLFRHFKALSNELWMPNVLACPSDDRTPAQSFGSLRNSNLSYFINMNLDDRCDTCPAVDKPNPKIVFGDRNVTNNTGSRSGILSVTVENYTSLSWDSRMHNRGKKPFQTSIGNVAYLDGSVATVISSDLPSAFKYSVFLHSTNRLAIP